MARKSKWLVGNGPKIDLLNMRRWYHEMEIWAQRCERSLKLVPGDFGLVADGAALDLCWKTLKKKGKKLRYKGLIGVISGMDSLEVEPVVQLLQELIIWVSEYVFPLAETKVIGKVGWKNMVFYGKNRFHNMV